MKKLSKLLMLVAIVIVAASCQNDVQTSASAVDTDQSAVNRGSEGGAANVIEQSQMVTFNGVTLDLSKIQMLELKMMEAGAADNAAEDAINIKNSLLGADKEEQMTDINFSMSEEAVSDGVFIFSIATENAKDLTMKMFDEEGFQLAAHNQFTVNTGDNYKALNVNSLESGEYTFRLEDAEGKELTRKVTVANK